MCLCVYCVVRRMYVCIKSSWPFDRSIKGVGGLLEDIHRIRPLQQIQFRLSSSCTHPIRKGPQDSYSLLQKTHTHTQREKRGLVCVCKLCMYIRAQVSIYHHIQERRKAANGSQNAFVKVRQGLKRRRTSLFYFFYFFFFCLSVCLSAS